MAILHGYVELEHDDWVIQNAANSAAGRAVIQIARELGYKTVNVVRREELIDELRAEGGDVVLVDGENCAIKCSEQPAARKFKLGLNAVGGDSALRLANCLAPDGTMVTFGAMSLQPVKIPNGLFIFKDLRFRGIWINKWYDNATQAERIATFRSDFSTWRSAGYSKRKWRSITSACRLQSGRDARGRRKTRRENRVQVCRA